MAPKTIALREAAAIPAPETVSTSDNNLPGVDTLFYDGQCPLCAGEIVQLRKTRGQQLRIVDVHDLTDGEGILQSKSSNGSKTPDKDQLLRVLHLRRADGSWLISADANVAAWEGTRHGRLLKILRWPLIRLFVDLGYTLWARWRYRRLYGRQFDEEAHAPQQH